MTDADNKNKAVWDWLLQNDEIQSLFFNFSPSEDGDTVIVPIVSDDPIRVYVDGTKIMQYDFSIVQYRTFNSNTPNNDENAQTIFDVENIMEWIRQQNIARNYPVFPEKCTITSVENLQSIPAVSGVNEVNAQYMFSVRIKYIEKR